MTSPPSVPDATPEPDPDALPKSDPDTLPPVSPKTRRVIALAVVAVSALAIYVCSGTPWLPFESATPRGSTPSPESTTSARGDQLPADKASDDGEVKVVERGYQPLQDDAGEEQVSWGAVVENTSEEMVAVVTLKLAILDKDGESLNKDHGDYALDPGVPAILPGQKVGIGDTIYVDGPGVGKIKLGVDEVGWYPRDSATPGFAKLEVGKIKSSWVGKGEKNPYWGDDGVGAYVDKRGDLLLRFRVDSGYEVLLKEPGASAVFRDEDGEIVGGSPPDDLDNWAEIPPGRSTQFIKVKYGPPEKFDESATEVYVYPTERV